MISEMTIGDTPRETSLVGASAVPSHAPAVNPQSTPNACSFLLVKRPGLRLHLEPSRRIAYFSEFYFSESR